MGNEQVQRIKNYLEALYDIPFDVNRIIKYGEPEYQIKPNNKLRELFIAKFKIINRIRIVIEVNPEKYAAASIKDMASASEEKKRVFLEYAKQLQVRRAKIDFYINDIRFDIEKTDEWPMEWNKYRLRVSRSPICAEDEEFNEEEIISAWAEMVIGMFLSLLNIVPIENDTQILEGGLKRIETNRYERNPVNRELCLLANGYMCKVCGFEFEKVYGDIGRHFIHVHHIVPVSSKETAYFLDPVNDLIPVCPNCHAMLHRTEPPMLPDELKQCIEKMKNNTK